MNRKILFLTHQFFPNHITGTEKLTLTTSQYLQKIGYDPVVVTYSPSEPFQSFTGFTDGCYFNEYIYEGIRVISFRAANETPDLSGRIHLEYVDDFAQMILEQEKPALVHAMHMMRVGTFLLVAKRLGIPYGLSLTDYWMVCHKAQMIRDNGELCGGCDEGRNCLANCGGLAPDYYAKRYAASREILKDSSFNMVSSGFLQHVFNLCIDDFVSTYIPYGLDYSYIAPKIQPHINGSGIRFGFIGTLSEHKGIQVLLNAIPHVQDHACKFFIYGDGPMRGEVEALAKTDPRVEYRGLYQKGDTLEVFANIDVALVVSLWYENSPLILQELMASTIPVIASNIGSLPELVTGGVDGFLIKPGNDKELAKVITSICNNPKILNDLKKNLMKLPRTTIEQQCFGIVELYEEMLG